MLAAWMAQTSHNKALLILDNCGIRNFAAMLATFEAVNVTVMALPPPMDPDVISTIKLSFQRDACPANVMAY
jgi:hypothetical protein